MNENVKRIVCSQREMISLDYGWDEEKRAPEIVKRNDERTPQEKRQQHLHPQPPVCIAHNEDVMA